MVQMFLKLISLKKEHHVTMWFDLYMMNAIVEAHAKPLSLVQMVCLSKYIQLKIMCMLGLKANQITIDLIWIGC